MFTADLITTLNKHTSVKGLFWWWPEDNGNKSVTNRWWNAALYDHNSGKPYAAFYELKNFVGSDTGIHFIDTTNDTDASWYTLDGRKLNRKPEAKGIYINRGKKIVLR